MPFYLKKSFKIGPFRLNASKSGLGISAGVKGFRVGAGPKGGYVHAGRGGLYYRKSLGSARAGAQDAYKPFSSDAVSSDITPPPEPRIHDLTLHSDKASASIAQAYKLRISQPPKPNYPWKVVAGLCALSLIAFSAEVFFMTSLLIIGTSIGLYKLILSRRPEDMQSSEFGDQTNSYRQIFDTFTQELKNKKVFLADVRRQIPLDSGGLQNIKQHLFSERSMLRMTPQFEYPPYVIGDAPSPCLVAQELTIYFMPAFILIIQGKDVSLIPYDKLTLVSSRAEFMAGSSPSEDPQPGSGAVGLIQLLSPIGILLTLISDDPKAFVGLIGSLVSMGVKTQFGEALCAIKVFKAQKK